jgi:hypothetical protein
MKVIREISEVLKKYKILKSLVVLLEELELSNFKFIFIPYCIDGAIVLIFFYF